MDEGDIMSSKASIALRLALMPFVGLIALFARTPRQKAAFQAETQRLAEGQRQSEAVMDRYLDSRDAAEEDASKEWVMPDDAAQPAPAATNRRH
jgi:hypothetical protein